MFVVEQATCPGQLRCLGQIGSLFFLNKPLVPGNFAAWGRFFLKKTNLFEETTCPGQLRCLWQNVFSKNVFFLNKPLVLASFAAWGRFFSQTMTFFLNKPLVRDVCAEQDVGNLEK